ncbi:MAG: M15 family metallopeptidase [Candidatus Omnitrophica bacterium]|nr:M15 family metallopeptidase [Candidatus Omnitrophota bacterium]
MRGVARMVKAVFSFFLFFTFSATFLSAYEPPIIIDSAKLEKDVFVNLHPECPSEIKNRQEIVDVQYFGLDGGLHRGQIVIDERLADDIREVFKTALESGFPFESVIPISDPRFLKDGRWDDDLSMAANNTSAFNFRVKTGGGNLSNHAYGYAIDINPALNPYIKGNLTLPPGAMYDPNQPGTLTEDHPVTQKFLELGWEWGGHWQSLKDYQHFEKIP